MFIVAQLIYSSKKNIMYKNYKSNYLLCSKLVCVVKNIVLTDHRSSQPMKTIDYYQSYQLYQ